jgi:hypothetical protein
MRSDVLSTENAGAFSVGGVCPSLRSEDLEAALGRLDFAHGDP